ncbi:MAG: PilN domain-containing protein [Fimbriimonas ginsengisoli]|uniref:PilN domain-containing protein n=1 Tax=Fimbriimonas ginsengisoli TaxID=1005039 RepID=A0A931LTM1_FIMGI|nr:PilN domain-containing protein [Fimbriimonas ginsengisoli]
MPYINLIQEQRLAVQNRERKARTFFLAFAVLGTASTLGFLTLFVESEVAQIEAVRLKSHIERTEPIVRQIEQQNAAFDSVSPKVKTLEDAQAITARWDRVLNHLAHQTPAEAWLTTVRSVAPDPTKPVNITFGGIAPAQEPVGEFILRLQNLPDLLDVNLKFTQEKIINQGRGIEFEINTNLADSADPAEVPKETKS